LQRLLEVFENHIEEADFTTEAFAREVGMSRMNLNRKLQALANQSTHEFLRTMRLKRAADLLKKYGGTVSEIAYKVGFNNSSYFAKAFREIYGVSPSRYVEKNK
jgi:transcriptional regulator GlxA family with amidase domain